MTRGAQISGPPPSPPPSGGTVRLFLSPLLTVIVGGSGAKIDSDKIDIVANTIRGGSRSPNAYVFSAKGAGSCKPGATPQGKVAPQTSAESANQGGVCFNPTHSVRQIRRRIYTKSRDTPLENCGCDGALPDSARIRERH